MKENKLDYIPEPMDLSSVDLPESLIQLSERIAENVHEVWAKARMDEGWTYGEKRDDIHKKHPCLVPYDELPEEEKEYDRNTAMNTIKMVKKLGFRIEKAIAGQSYSRHYFSSIPECIFAMQNQSFRNKKR